MSKDKHQNILDETPASPQLEMANLPEENKKKEIMLITICQTKHNPLATSILKNFILVYKNNGRNIDLNEVDNYQNCATHYTAANGNSEALELLIAEGADLTLKNNEGCTPLMLACKREHKITVRHEEVVQLLINSGKEIGLNEVDNSKSCAAHYNANNGNSGAMALLIDAGADLTLKNSGGYTPLMLACIKGHKEVVQLLINSGQDLNEVDHKGRNALHFAVKSNNLPICNLLIEKGVQLDTQTNSAKRTPLMVAVKKGYNDIAEALMNKSTSNILDCQDKNKDTAADIALKKENSQAVRLINERRNNLSSSLSF